MTSPTLSAADHTAIDTVLQSTDRLLSENYPGDDGTRQPVHTVYVPADRFTETLVADWGAEALAALGAQGGIEALCTAMGLPAPLIDQVSGRVTAKLHSEPIEDLRLDFEDGYGLRPDAEEDSDTLRVADLVAATAKDGTSPPFIGIRFKSFEESTRARGLRTLDLFIARMMERGGLPEGLVLTLPKVSTAAQVEAMVYACEKLEQSHALPAGRLRFEVQVETPQLILAADGTVPVAKLLHVGNGRVSALHYGTYDYSASLEIAAAHQAMDHPAADFAKQVMQVAVAGTGVRLSDGSTNILPLGSDENIRSAWKLHSTLVQRSLERGYYQGWDLHPAQLPSRFAATYLFYRQGFGAAAARLRNYAHRLESTVLDEPATARALARFLQRGLLCGAVDPQDIEDEVRISAHQLAALARTGLMPTVEENND
ncbi:MULTISPECIES: DUF6986 family protein [unclassified Arthrobacter]|uniref:DUF6986 family protein n=1 Tax=unclassified Arthrobacter TaxID=235627 RepID=UPI0014923ABA|nr:MULTISPECIES: aldolase/citrate lyase family protein [unclassified Arthrobacter]MBE0009979.1 aldolase [Arthrobacter sp. AET 35A]NOJ63848.1 aldolase [Arthrobacter sp. 147(2020)]